MTGPSSGVIDAPPRSVRLFVVAGEPSGDRHAAAVVRELRHLVPELKVEGVGGQALRDAGARLLADSTRWTAIGVLDALRRVPRIAWNYPRILRHLVQNPPDAVLLVDFGAFNARLARRLRTVLTRILYYIPPRCWDRTAARGDLLDLVDAIATPFPWSAERLRGGRARVEWVGHPVLDHCSEAADKPAGSPTTLALLPGSRPLEARLLLPLYAQVVNALSERLGGSLRVLVCWAPSLPAWQRDRARALLPSAEWVDGVTSDALHRADAAIVCSGTATLEVACAGTPMVIVYRVPWWQMPEYQLRKRLTPLPFIGLPNILLGRAAVPEFHGPAAAAPRVTDEVTRLLTQPVAAEAQRRALAEVRAALGTPGAARRTAAMLAALLREPARVYPPAVA